MPQVISIVGKSNSGKTTFIENLIPELKAMGYKVGVVKHTHHQIEIDKEGKDSWRHQKAGADSVAIISPHRFVVVKQTEIEMSLDELQVLFSNVDIILTEGYKSADKPKIEVFRKEIHAAPISGIDDSRVAIVSDDDIKIDVPIFSTVSYKDVALFVVKNFIKTD